MNQALVNWLIAQGWALAGWLLVVGLPALAVYGVRYLEAHTADKRWDTLRVVAEDAVTYAQQTLQANPEKKRLAVQFVQTYLDSIGWRLPVAVIVGAVESAVYTEIKAPAATATQIAPGADALARLARIADTDKRAG